MPTIEALLSYARPLDGLTADPSSPWRADYLDLIAPGETPHRAAEMATMYGCALVARGYLRRFIQHPLLDAPYATGHAVSDLMTIARAAHAVRPMHELPQLGDIVLVSAPEHVWIVLAQPHATFEGAVLYEGLDGLQVDGFRAVVMREHVVRGGRDDAGGDRAIVAVIDTCRVVAAFGR